MPGPGPAEGMGPPGRVGRDPGAPGKEGPCAGAPARTGNWGPPALGLPGNTVRPGVGWPAANRQTVLIAVSQVLSKSFLISTSQQLVLIMEEARLAARRCGKELLSSSWTEK